MEKFFQKFSSQEKRIEIIEKIISADPIYVKLEKYDGFNKLDKVYSLNDIAVCANSFIEKYFIYDLNNPLTTQFDDKVFFEPDKRNIKREGRRNAIAKYAVHFITASNEKTRTRHYDVSKASSFESIFEALNNSKDRVEIKKPTGEVRINYYYKLDDKFNMEIVCEPISLGDGTLRIITFAPNKSNSYVSKKLSPPEAGIKPHD